MNDLQCALIKSAFHRYWLSEKHLKLKSVRKEASVVLERVRVESKKNTPSLECISDLREFLCDVVALSCGKNFESKLFFKNCSIKVWFVMTGVNNAKSDHEKLMLLTELHGVGVKTATFILSAFYPSQWGYVADPSHYYAAHIGFVHGEKEDFQNISADSAIEVNRELLKISKQTELEVADVSCAMFFLFFYGYKKGFRSGTGKKYGSSYE